MSAAVMLAGLAVSTAGPASAATAVTLYASPTGTGATCDTPANACSLTGAKSQAQAQLHASPGADVTVNLLDGTYRLAGTWTFGAADSGSSGHPVVWQAADGAHPVISGANQITGWTQTGTSGVWSASVPAGSASRQLYVNGKEAPIAQASATALGFTGSWSGSSTGYNISGDSKAVSWFGNLTATQVKEVEFDYPAGNGDWTESRCRVASYDSTAKTLTMAQPCWNNTTNRAAFQHASGGLPKLSTGTKPTLVENAKALLHPGQWLLDSAANTLYYQPLPGQQMNSLDVELPRLESLLQGAGTLANPLHDLTFKGLQFSYATWNAPSGAEGFSDVQSNLRMTLPPNGNTGYANQAMCNFALDPNTKQPISAGTCPWGALTQPLANVAFSAANNITLTGNRFAELGGAGLSVMYGSANTLIQGNEFTDIASTGMLLGCTYDPLPTDSSEAAGIKQHCTPNPSAVSGDTVGTNEILSKTTVSDNIIHRIGTDYSSACGITLLFSRDTTITHNDLYDLPYSGITAGVIQGHVDQNGDSQNSTNINEDNTISNNLIHNFMSVRRDGGAIYIEGHQAQYYDTNGNLTTYDKADRTNTLKHGMQVTGNVAYQNTTTNFTYYDDAGAEWINWNDNVGFDEGHFSQGGCNPTGHFSITGNYISSAIKSYPCRVGPTDSIDSGNITSSSTPGPDDISNNPSGTQIKTSLFTGAGVNPAYSALAAAAGPQISYVSPATTANQVLIGGEGFTPSTPVYAGGTQVSNVQYLSGGFLIATVPAGTPAYKISVGAPSAVSRINDADSSITYNGFSYGGNRGLGDYNDDVHYATANGSTATYTFTGTGIQIYGEQDTDQGAIGIVIDNGTEQILNTYTEDGRHSNVIIYTATGLAAGVSHKILITKLSGTYATLDGFGYGNIGPAKPRVNDTDSSIAYSGFSYAANRTYGDFSADVHYATANNSTATYMFTGTGIQVFGEQYTDQGNLGIRIDNGTQQTVNTVPTDGKRHSNVAIYTASGLSPATHTIVITKLTGTYATLDGFGIP